MNQNVIEFLLDSYQAAFPPSFLFGAAGITTISILSGLHYLISNKMKIEQDGKRRSPHMKAIAIRSYNGVSSIRVLADMPIPKILNETEVLIKVVAAGIDPIDLKVTRGYGRAIRSYLRAYNTHVQGTPFVILGRECSGIVLAVGSEVTTVKKGDNVWAFSAYCFEGLMAEYVVVKEEQVALMPRNLTFEEAATLPYTAIQAWNVIERQASLTTESAEGKRILVHAGNSPVSLLMMQILKSWGADVTTTVPTAGLPMCHELGIGDVIVYSVTDFERELRRRKRFDIVINTIGTIVHQLCAEVCSPGGKIITLVSTPILSDRFGLTVGTILVTVLQIAAWIKRVKYGASLFWWDNLSYDKKYLQKTSRLVEEGKVYPVFERTYSIDEAIHGFQNLAQYNNVGKSVVQMSSINPYFLREKSFLSDI